MPNYSLPNFLICGAAQSGTSFLYSALKQHPDIYLPPTPVPEPHFFLKDWEYEKGLPSYSAQWFPNSNGERARGEKSSSYMYGGRKTLYRIRQDLPGVRLILMLRDPVERTWANYRFSVLNGLENLSFEEALEEEPRRNREAKGQWATVKPYDYMGRSHYGKQLSDILSIFPREYVLALKSENFRRNPEKNFKKIFNFLEVSNAFSPTLPSPFSTPEVIDPALQFKLRNDFGDRFGLILRGFRQRVSDIFVHAENMAERKLLEELQQNITYEKSELPKVTRQKLRNFFREDLELLSPLVDFPIDDWLQEPLVP